MIVGVLGVMLDIALFAPRRRRVTTTSYPAVSSTGTVTRSDEVL